MTNCISCSVVAYNIAFKNQKKRAQYPCNDIPRKKREYKFTKGAASSLWLLDINTQQRKKKFSQRCIYGRYRPVDTTIEQNSADLSRLLCKDIFLYSQAFEIHHCSYDSAYVSLRQESILQGSRSQEATHEGNYPTLTRRIVR